MEKAGIEKNLPLPVNPKIKQKKLQTLKKQMILRKLKTPKTTSWQFNQIKKYIYFPIHRF